MMLKGYGQGTCITNAQKSLKNIIRAGKVKSLILTVALWQDTKVLGWEVSDMDLELFNGLMVLLILAIGLMIEQMAKVVSNIQMETFMKAIGSKTKLMDQVFTKI